ncbi:MAG: transcription elongation factor 1 family protein [Candidatus Hodarchaeales archaeon]|jgi:transcription elongation factor Elf1
MGRKRKRIVRTKPIPTLPTVFDCPICGTTNSINIDINRKIRTAVIFCGKCKIQTTKPIRPIEERVDVFGDWIDQLVAESEQAESISTISEKPDISEEEQIKEK